jgi:REP element-mobilizing transposase RayT
MAGQRIRDTVAPASGRQPTDEVRVRSRGRLPHWERDDATYFVTFRLFDSLPATALQRIKEANQRSTPTSADYAHRLDAYLDQGSGASFLKDRRIATLVVDALRHFDGMRYCLHAWCVMPNHVHVVFSSMPARTPALRLSAVIQSWKSYTAKEANRLLGRSGSFWQREYYDHLVRDEADFVRCIDYTIHNPVKAGLCERREDWPATGLRLDSDPLPSA